MIAQIINGKVPVICLSHILRQRTQTRGLIIHDIKKNQTQYVFYYTFFKQSTKEDTSLCLQKFEITTWAGGLEIRQTLNPK